MSITRRSFVLGASALALSACSTPKLNLPGSVPEGSFTPQTRRKIFVATNRMVSNDPSQGFMETRSDSQLYQNYDISIPTDRDPGEFSFPKRRLDPERQFFVTDSARYSGASGFVRGLEQAALARRPGDRGVVLFVHGFNVSYPGAVFRAAQIATDFDLPQPMALFSWPSAGKITGYPYDRDSVLFARDALAQTLKDLAHSRIEKVTVLAHSMGGLLTMEALKQLALQGDRRTLDRLNGVVLIQPDIDVDVFRHQVKSLRPYQVETMVVASRRDRALKVSSILTGGHPRVGEAENIEELRDMGVLVLDVSGTKTDRLGHSALMKSPELLSVIASGELLERIVEGAPGQDVLISGINLTGQAALAIAYLPYTLTGG